MVIVVMVVPKPPAIAPRIREVAERRASGWVRRSVKLDLETMLVRPESPDGRPKSTAWT